MNQEGNLGDITSSGNFTEANLSEDENLRPVTGWNFAESDQTPRQRFNSVSGSGIIGAQTQPRRNVTTILDMPNTTSTSGSRPPQQDFMGELSRNFQSNLSEMGSNLQRQASRGSAAVVAARIATVASSRDHEGDRIRQIDTRQQQRDQQQQEQQQNNPGTEESEDDSFPFSGFFSQMVRTNPELAGVLSACEKYIPFVLILIIKQLYDHSTGIFVCVALIATFYHANSVVCREVSRNGRRALWPLLIVMVNLTACIGLIYFVFEDEKLYLCALFIPNGKITSLSELLWIVGVNNFVLKFVSVIIKILVILLPASVILHRKRGNYFLFIELTSQLHRTLVPIPVWLFYLLDHNDRIPAKVLGVILTAAYMVFKGKSILKTALAWKVAASKLMQSTRYGLSPSHDELKATGGTCPICHDNLSDPTKLHCKHIFCEECVTIWFDREKTCPMCRAQVTEDPSWRDGSTSQFVQLF